MAGIPVSALRRALAMLTENPHTAGAFAGGAVGGVTGFNEGARIGGPVHDEDGNEVGYQSLAGLGGATGVLGGMALGASGVGLARLGMRGASSLRQALAERAAARGMGRAAEREATHLDDAERFAAGSSEARYERTLALTRAAEWARANGLNPEEFNPDELLEAYAREVGDSLPRLRNGPYTSGMGRTGYD